jgi:hypothetical protein
MRAALTSSRKLTICRGISRRVFVDMLQIAIKIRRPSCHTDRTSVERLSGQQFTCCSRVLPAVTKCAQGREVGRNWNNCIQCLLIWSMHKRR